MSTAIDIADAVVASLNAEFAGQFTAVRYYQPRFKLEELKTLHVSVVPKSVEIERSDRASCEHDYAVDVAIHQRVDPENVAQLDALMTLVETICDHLLSTRPNGSVATNIENRPIFDPEMLNDQRVILSLLTVTYSAWR